MSPHIPGAGEQALGQMLSQQLKDYHLPAPVSWWPPAPGWWLMTCLLLAALFALIWFMRGTYRRRAAMRAALKELRSIRAATDRDDNTLMQALSRLLRRFALARFPRQQVAGLTGDEWLKFLDQHGGDGAFSNGIGRCFANSPYRRGKQIAGKELLTLVENWIKKNPGAET